MSQVTTNSNPLGNFIEAACVPIGPGAYSHRSGNLEASETILKAHPGLAVGNLIVAAILGNDKEAEDLLSENPNQAVMKAGPRNWDLLTYLCFSRYLRLDKTRSEGFVRVAKALLN